MRAPPSAPRRCRKLVLLLGVMSLAPPCAAARGAEPRSSAVDPEEALSTPPHDEPGDGESEGEPLGAVSPEAGPEEQEETDDAAPALGTAPDEHEKIRSKAAFSSSAFGPSYFVEGIQLLTETRTQPALILALLDIHPGEVLHANDARVDLARLRLIGSGLFLNARLSLRRGVRPGGVILQVELEERGSFILDDIFLGTSRATDFWAGGSVTEGNLTGNGLSLGAAFVASTTPNIAGASRALAGQLRIGFPAYLTGGYALSASLTYSDGSDFYRVRGAADDADPGAFVARDLQRLSARLGATRDLVRRFRVYLGVRTDALSAAAPGASERTFEDGSTRPIDYHLRPDFSRVMAIALSVSHDTRGDRVMPRAGHVVTLANETASGLLGSYSFTKVTLAGSQFFGLPRGHAFGVHLFVGSIFGEAPQFDRFFVGDLDELLAPRALGLNFSTQAPPAFGSAIGRHRYDDFAGRLSGEYVAPLWKRHGWVYGGYAFCSLGVFGMFSKTNESPAVGSGWATWPVGFTGDIGLRLDTAIGLFRLSVGNLLGRVSF